MPHPERERLAEFVAGRASDEEAMTIYSHLAECRPCTQRFLALRKIRADFSGSWDAFLAEFRLRLEFFSAQGETDRSFCPAVVIRGLLSGSKRLATAAMVRFTEKSEAILGAGFSLEAVFVPSHTGVGDARTDPEARRLAGQASEECSHASDEEALAKLAKISETDPMISETARLDLISQDKVVGKVIVQSASRLVSVLVYPTLLGTSSCVAVLRLLDAEEGAEPSERRVRLDPIEGASYLLAEFEDVPDGPFLVGLEIAPPAPRS